ncbi:MAG: PilZ domain-containing protein, partial [Candidatus Aureabacteria bacterium]|nr:PilZ domain-containing protein [Candidatus Auribacterota bacterium]
PFNGKGSEELLAVADKALYRAKEKGRDRVVVEQRRWMRVKPSSKMHVGLVPEGKSEKFQAVDVLNVSQRGMLLLFSASVSTGPGLCYVHFSQEDEPACVPCQIVHQRKTGEHLFLVGIHMKEMTPEIEEQLLCYIRY